MPIPALTKVVVFEPVPILEKAVAVEENDHVLVKSVLVDAVPIPVFEVPFTALENEVVVEEPVPNL